MPRRIYVNPFKKSGQVASSSLRTNNLGWLLKKHEACAHSTWRVRGTEYEVTNPYNPYTVTLVIPIVNPLTKSR